MQVSVVTLKGLERKVTISVPTDIVENEVSSTLKNFARKVKVDGFRPGKVPMHVVNSRFLGAAHEEVARKLIESTLPEALEKEDLSPLSYPAVDVQPIEKGKEFTYSAVFEVLPEFEAAELNQAEVEQVRSEVTQKDVDAMLEKLRDQHKDWNEVNHKVKKDNKVVIDFEGFLDGTPFDGGSAEGHELVLGSGSMIPGFEEGIIGATKDTPFDIQVKFPEEYGHEKLAGKEATFKITVKKVMEGVLPALDDAFAEKFNIKEGGVEALTKDIKENMTRELERRLSSLNRDTLFNHFLKANPVEVPVVLVDREIENLKHEMYHKIFGHEHHENEKIPDFPRVLFEEQAKRRVQLGLLFTEYVKKHEIKAQPEQLNAKIDSFANAYESPDELRTYYQNNKELMGQIEDLVMEELVADKIAADAKINYTNSDYDAVMNPKKGTESKGE